MRQTERFEQVLKPIAFIRIQSQNTKSASHVSSPADLYLYVKVDCNQQLGKTDFYFYTFFSRNHHNFELNIAVLN